MSDWKPDESRGFAQGLGAHRGGKVMDREEVRERDRADQEQGNRNGGLLVLATEIRGCNALQPFVYAASRPKTLMRTAMAKNGPFRSLSDRSKMLDFKR